MKKLALLLLVTTSILANNLPDGTIKAGSLANQKLADDTTPLLLVKVQAHCDTPETLQKFIREMPSGEVGSRIWKETWVVGGCNNHYATKIDFMETKDGAIYNIKDVDIITMQTHTAPDNDLSNRIAIFLNEQFEETKQIPRDRFISVIEQETQKAMDYGLKTEQQVVTYVTTAWLLGIDFDTEFPAATEILNSSDYTADKKAQFLEEWTIKMFEALEEK